MRNNTKVKFVLIGLGVILSVSTVLAASRTVNVLMLPDLSDWNKEIFSGETFYELVNIDDRQAIKAVSNNSASGMVRKIDVDLTKTPYLNWSWRVDSSLEELDEAEKSGDDYAARVYVVISGGVFFWRTRAINYVWAGRHQKGSSWANAYTSNVIMLAVDSGQEYAGQWVRHKRNVMEDLKMLHGIDKTRIDAVAIMTDTDNSNKSATAYYGDIYFTKD